MHYARAYLLTGSTLN